MNKIFLYDGQVYTGEILDIYEYDDFFHSCPVSCIVIKTRDGEIEINDYEIKSII